MDFNEGTGLHGRDVFQRMTFPWIYLVEFGLWLPLLAGFFLTTAFLAAKPLAELSAQGVVLPASWEAGVPNHGKYFEWYLISNHPAAFALSVALLLLSAVALYPVYKRQLTFRNSDGPGRATAHNIANGCVMAGLVLVVVAFFKAAF